MEIVLNTCFGGFGLSHKGVMHYAGLKGIEIFASVNSRDKGRLVPYTGGDPFSIYYSRKPLVNGKVPVNAYFDEYEIKRDDPDLVQTVKDLGKEADGASAKLKVITIPDGVDWEIDEYDGLEHIAEKHRTWR